MTTLRTAVALLSVLAATPASATTAFECKLKNAQGEPMDLIFVTDKVGLPFETGSGTMIGNNGSSDVAVTRSLHGINFLEFTETGNVMLTTIVLPEGGLKGSPTPDLPGAHSRHTVFVDFKSDAQIQPMLPSQYTGPCTAKF